MTYRYLVKSLLVLFIFFTASVIYQSTAYSFYNPLNYFKGTLAETDGDQAYAEKNYPAAFEAYKKAAEAGNPYGQFMLANMYLAGEAVDKNPERYMHWLGKAAENEYPPASYLLGMAYLHGDKSVAVRHLKSAADKEHGAAMHMLGILYATGTGVSKSTNEAVRWFRLASAQGVPVPDQLLTQSGIETYFKRSALAKKQDNLVQQIQQRLIELGYNPGPADGLYGKKTRDAIIAFQQKNGLKADGLASVNLLESLKGTSRQ